MATCARYRSSCIARRSTRIHDFLLHLRRLRRTCRPYIPILLRLCIVMFTIIELRPISTPMHAHVLNTISRATVLTAITAAFLSVIFFDTPIFGFIVIAALSVQFVLNLIHNHNSPFFHLLAALCFNSTAILFSTTVGRRRSITKPSALRAALRHSHNYAASLRSVRNVDILEVGARLQASLLAVDYAMCGKVGPSALYFTLPFAALYLVGYSTQRNGSVVVVLLLAFSVVTDHSAILGFNFFKSVVTVGSATLSLLVGPGLLTVDEWLASAEQLCY